MNKDEFDWLLSVWITSWLASIGPVRLDTASLSSFLGTSLVSHLQSLRCSRVTLLHLALLTSLYLVLVQLFSDIASLFFSLTDNWQCFIDPKSTMHNISQLWYHRGHFHALAEGPKVLRPCFHWSLHSNHNG